MITAEMEEVGIKSAVPSPAEPVPDEFDLLCEHCGYSLVGLIDSKRCPECGKEFDPNQLPLARVPWLYRVRLGRVRAYLATVSLILHSPKKFAAELCRPVRISAADATRFRQVTIRIVMIFALLTVLGVELAFLFAIWPFRLWLREVMLLVAVPSLALICLRIMLGLSTDMPTFIWKGLPASPSDLAPLHQYASAPLALAPLLVMLGVVAVLVRSALSRFNIDSTELMLTGGVVALIILTLMWLVALAFMSAATSCSRKELFKLGLYLPFHWLIISAMGFALWMASVMTLSDIMQKFMRH